MATLNAIYKISADITNLQQGMDRAARATEGLEKNASNVSAVLSGMGKAFIGAFSVAAISGAVKSFTDLTGSLTDLSAKTGISTTELQKLKYAAELSGGTLDGVTRAIGIMARTLIEGDSSAVGAMKRLGLNINEVRQMQPADAFSTIADAIAKIPNPMERSTLAMQIFGKSGAELLPMITGGMTEAMQAAERLGIVMDAETVAAGDRLGDTFTTLSAVGQGVIGRVLTPMLPAIQMLADAMTGLGGVVTWLQEAFSTLLKWGVQALKFFIDAAVSVTEFASKVPILGRSVRDVDRAALESAKQWSTWFGDMAKGFDTVVPKAVAKASTLAGAMTAVGLETKTAHQTAEASGKAYRAELERIADANAGLVAESYKTLVKNIRDYEQANYEAANAIAQHGLKVADFGVTVAVTEPIIEATLLTQARMIPVLQGIEDGISRVGQAYALTTPQIVADAEAHAAAVKKTDTQLKALSQSLMELATVAGGSFGAVASGLASLVSGASAARSAIESLKTGIKAGFSLDGILGITSGIGGIVSVAMTAINALKKLFSLGGPSEEQLAGRKLIADFHAELEAMLTVAQRAEAGNEAWKMDVIAIRDAYLAAGRTIEEAEAATKALWESAEGGSETARRQIEKIRAVINQNTAATDQATSATEEQAQATIETATQAARALEELGPKIATNEDQWRHWGGVVTDQIIAIAAGLRSLALPSVGGGPAISPEGSVSVNGGSGAALSGPIVLEVDGEVMARSVDAYQVNQYKNQYRLGFVGT